MFFLSFSLDYMKSSNATTRFAAILLCLLQTHKEASCRKNILDTTL